MEDCIGQYLTRLLYSPILPQFDCAYSAWCPNLNKYFKSKLQAIHNNCVRFCLQLNAKNHNRVKELEKLNWLPVSERFNQQFCSNDFTFFSGSCPLYRAKIKQTQDLGF